MRKRGAGWIVVLGSVTAQPPARPYDEWAIHGGASVYAAVKAAVHRFVQGAAAELLAENIAVNMLAPSTAIRTPGASDLIPEEYPSERIEYIVETGLALCHRPAAERTGLCAYSLHFPLAHGLPVHTLDGRERIADPLISVARGRRGAPPDRERAHAGQDRAESAGPLSIICRRGTPGGTRWTEIGWARCST